MNKPLSISIALILTLSIFFIFFDKTNNSPIPKKESFVVSRVIDGDTLVLNNSKTVRLLNINTPEKNSPLSALSIFFMSSFENKTLQFELLKTDKYNRTLARAYFPQYLNLELVKQGLSSKFLVEDSEKELFSKAEREAIENSRGIWNKSEYYGCFSAEINPSEEVIKLINSCDKIYLLDWQLKDESRKTYLFRNHIIDSLNLHSGIGIDNSTDLFWNSKTSIWNNDADSLYLFDSKGNIALYEDYGYSA